LTRSWIRDEFVDGGLEVSTWAIFDIAYSSTRPFSVGFVLATASCGTQQL
jgi:hypothetical protein